MKRYHEEKHIIDRRAAESKQMWGYESKNLSRYRKTHNGCNKASCQLCHPEKYPKRIPTAKELQSKKDLENYGS